MRSEFVAIAAALLMNLVSGCGSASSAAPLQVYTNGAFWTGVVGQPKATTMVVRDGRILAIGDDQVAENYKQDDAQVIDLAGDFVVPGFIDNHTHFLSGSFGLSGVDLRDAHTPELFVQRIAEFAASQNPGNWLMEGDWDHELWGGELPTRAWIDGVTPDNPVFVVRLDGHMALANSVALDRAGITADTHNPVGGEIVRDGKGEPTGVLKDTAMDLVAGVITPRTSDDYDKALDAGMAHALARGVTQIHDVGGWKNLSAFRRARADGRLKFRVYSFVPLADWQRAADYVAKQGRGDDWVRWGGVKGLVDGSLGSTTAWFYEPYTDTPSTSGLLLQDTQQLREWLISADAAGLHIAIHAIGQRANDWLLDAFEEAVLENGAFRSDLPERRFRIEHAQHLTKQAIPRFAQLHVIPSMQPYHAIDDGRWAEKRIGPDRIQRTYAFASLLAADANVTFGSDWTVAPIDPLLGIHAAVVRETLDGANPGGWVPEQRISVVQALRAYTQANAFAGYQEDKLGTLKVGKLADFVVLSENLLEIEPRQIAAVKVLRTYVGDEAMYVAEDHGSATR